MSPVLGLVCLRMIGEYMKIVVEDCIVWVCGKFSIYPN